MDLQLSSPTRAASATEGNLTQTRHSSRHRKAPDRFDPSAPLAPLLIVTPDPKKKKKKGPKENHSLKAEEVKMIVERRVKLVTEQHNIPKPSQVEGFPMKEWTIEIYVLDEAGKEKSAKCFTKVVFNLHPSFENPVQTFHEPPFKCTNEGWGEFEMSIDCYTTEKGGKQTIIHDLNFANATYDNIHTIQFKNPSQALQAILRETGPLPSDEDRKARNKPQEGVKKKKPFDIEKMAEAIQKLGEDDLMHVIQLIHDHKSEDTYIINNVDVVVSPPAGEFSVDLYTIPDSLGKLLWDFLLQTSEAPNLR